MHSGQRPRSPVPEKSLTSSISSASKCRVDGMQDPSKRHELDRTTVRSLVCALCDLRQPVSATCAGCGVEFGAYSCLKCCFFDDDLEKQQFHCEACGICRVGGASNFFHCNTCGCCYANSLQVAPAILCFVSANANVTTGLFTQRHLSSIAINTDP